MQKKKDEKGRVVGRREFMQQAGKAGISSGLASFLLVGGISNRAFSVSDTDGCESPYESGSSHGGDTCAPQAPHNNDDVCKIEGVTPSANGHAEGDECVAGDDHKDGDACVRGNSAQQWLDDSCNANAYDENHCTNRFPETGDIM